MLKKIHNDSDGHSFNKIHRKYKQYKHMKVNVRKRTIQVYAL